MTRWPFAGQLKDGNRAVGFPTITFPCEMASNLDMETLIAGHVHVAKYGGIVVLSDFPARASFPLLLERLNIFTDPQRPMTVTEGIYEINSPDENSPVHGDHQLRPDLFYRLRRNRGQSCPGLAADQGFRRSVRAHRLGRRQILRRRRGHVC
jgi:hypothetical protein